MRFKHALALTTLCLCVVALPALSAEKDYKNKRRTLHVPMGQERLVLEAPLGMCFVDQARYTESSVYNSLKKMLRDKGDSILMAAFMHCDDLANPGHPESKGGNMPTIGIVTWANPAVGEKTEFERQDYLDFREASFREYVIVALADMAGFNTDAGAQALEEAAYEMTGEDAPRLADSVTRTANGVMLGYEDSRSMSGKNYKAQGIVATTTVRRFPIEIFMQINTETDAKTTQDVQNDMEKFIAQQIALNE